MKKETRYFKPEDLPSGLKIALYEMLLERLKAEDIPEKITQIVINLEASEIRRHCVTHPEDFLGYPIDEFDMHGTKKIKFLCNINPDNLDIVGCRITRYT